MRKWLQWYQYCEINSIPSIMWKKMFTHFCSRFQPIEKTKQTFLIEFVFSLWNGLIYFPSPIYIFTPFVSETGKWSDSVPNLCDFFSAVHMRFRCIHFEMSHIFPVCCLFSPLIAMLCVILFRIAPDELVIISNIYLWAHVVVRMFVCVWENICGIE